MYSIGTAKGVCITLWVCIFFKGVKDELLFMGMSIGASYVFGMTVKQGKKETFFSLKMYGIGLYKNPARFIHVFIHVFIHIYFNGKIFFANWC